MSTVRANNYYDASGGSNAQLFGVASPPNSMGFRNRIINGGMVIDQRNAGASVNLSATGQYTVDRWLAWEDTDGTMTAQQSSVAPAGFTNSLLFTTGTADSSLGATQFAAVQQRIEGFNVADLGWGTASAATVTLSFWVRSSLTGAFGGVVKNAGGAGARSYPFTYTISAANTWEQKSVTIAGDTTGTWLTNNGIGINVGFGLGVGSTYSGTAGSWQGSDFLSATGAVSVVGTNGATFYITGVQLEAGTNASAFERRPYGTELMLCQRYYQILQNAGGGRAESTTFLNMPFRTLCTMRTAPSGAIVGTIAVRDLSAGATRTATTPGSLNLGIANDTGGYLEFGASSWSPGNYTIGNLCALACSTGINGIALSSEL